MNDLETILRSIHEMERPGFPFGGTLPPVRASVLALFHGEDFMSSEVLLIKRSETVLTHVGQVAFPGGGVEDQDKGDLIRTALRETREEVGLSPEGILAIGLLPGLPTVNGGMGVVPVLAMADRQVREAPLIPDLNEVAFTEWVPVLDLVETRTEVPREVRGQSLLLPEFRWKSERMWGLTALIFDLILRRYAKIRA